MSDHALDGTVHKFAHQMWGFQGENQGLLMDRQIYVEPITSPTSGIQEAIDSLQEQGGRVHIPAGRWHLSRSICLPSGVSLVGDGPATVLHISPLKVARLAKAVRKGGRVLTLKGKVPYRVGQEIGISDEVLSGWWGTHGIVEAIKGQQIHLSARFNRGLSVADDAKAVSLFPAITADGATDAELANFTIRGPKGYKGKWWDFTYSAIHLVSCQRVRVTNVTVFEWPSDGIGVQRGSDVQVSQCQSHGCRGHGFHPGTGLARSIWSHNIGKGNGGDGFFFCARVHHSTCSDSVFSENGLAGIGGVARGGDHHNIISDNVCSYNQKWGIEATRGDEQIIAGNLVLSNSQERAGEFPGIRLHDMERNVVTSNRLADDQNEPTQTKGIVESGATDYNLISSNLCAGMKQGVIIVGAHSRAEGNLT
ncbi:MAG: right-handed parallel beta-helix repeat-containing protein [Candidatus Latescibacterota bacterium]|nr:right-handed parallel beta-helix repeat-containing protein [Candidatus Latescibacterota bacterium]